MTNSTLENELVANLASVRERLHLLTLERDEALARAAKLEHERDTLMDQLRSALARVAVLEEIG